MINDEKYYFEGYLSIMSLKGIRKKIILIMFNEKMLMVILIIRK